MSITLEKPPIDEKRKHWSDWFHKIYLLITGMLLPVKTDSTRGDAGTAGRVIFNSGDGQLNIDNGTNWTLPDGTVT